jgi:hypothetical protein
MGELNWRKARASASNGGCIEVADRDGTVLVRDTRARERGHLAVDASAWARFVAKIKAGVLPVRSRAPVSGFASWGSAVGVRGWPDERASSAVE